MARVRFNAQSDAADGFALGLRRVGGPDRQGFDGTGGDDRITGTADDDYFNMTQGGRDVVRGLAGDDYAEFGSTFDARDTFNGGDGYDYLYLSGSYDLTVTSAMLTNVEEIDLGSGGTYRLTIGAGVASTSSNFQVYAYPTSNATTVVSVDATAVTTAIGWYSSGGQDTFLSGAGDDYFKARSTGVVYYDGGAGYNRISLYGLAEGVTFDLGVTGAQQVAGASITIRNIQDVSGTEGADMLTGTAAGNWFLGNGGDDTMIGLAGDDLFTVGGGSRGVLATAITLDGGRGIDTLSINGTTTFTSGLTVSLQETGFQVTGQGTMKLTGIEWVTGTQFGDAITGSKGANSLFGDDGEDVLNGGSGDDALYGDALYGLDSPYGYDAPRQIFENADAAFADTLLGGGGRDRLDGGGGDDRLTGGADADVLIGGAGADLFVFVNPADSVGANADTIQDFVTGDRIDVSAIDADPATRGNQDFHFGQTRERVGDITVAYDSASDQTIVSLFLDGDRRADMTINLTGNVALTAADFVL